jgi:hypothetical protein
MRLVLSNFSNIRLSYITLLQIEMISVNDNVSTSQGKKEEIIRLIIAMIIYMSPIYLIGAALDDNHALFQIVMIVAASWSVMGIFISYYISSKLHDLCYLKQ